MGSEQGFCDECGSYRNVLKECENKKCEEYVDRSKND